ncbi:hypothetical protein BS50DRAFT_114589 [Corynespora cassiicola Philippines]|uniref:Uncharacterized protein n=1 Tax=Corynespora cassiicola Philippines TaxID=1448308 RepID=A0A2T2NE19_CORCC|nr:hypothetical protein BS50DRAFT_114589 [Corynespora cassiicola Philippines]
MLLLTIHAPFAHVLLSKVIKALFHRLDLSSIPTFCSTSLFCCSFFFHSTLWEIFLAMLLLFSRSNSNRTYVHFSFISKLSLYLRN